MLRYIIDVSEMGQFVTLDNGIRYEVSPDDYPTSALWYGSQQSRIVPSRSKVFSVRLHNASTGEVVKARRVTESDSSNDD
jgi:hypothetical protein